MIGRTWPTNRVLTPRGSAARAAYRFVASETVPPRTTTNIRWPRSGDRACEQEIDLMYSTDDAEPFTLPRNVVIIFRDRALRTVRSLSWTRRCGAASDSLRCTQRRSPRNLLLRRWLAARKYPQRVADLHHALNAAIDDPDVPVRTLVFHASGGPQ
ncbi:hypothetical protein LRQ08_30245 (plasmid) [Rhodococcus qingshengii]|uniref:hypothetical protein n=1 Tax=Rhodococcus qingshengii TaxID=334542 RepID=UPI00211238B4|nr:hypothetical protein [Rhodococcus qingshengii]UUE28732.1 hypothetical protein LRQ08_30245 [Rhodococcus qingshengii]